MNSIVGVLLNQRFVFAFDVVRSLYLETVLSHDLHEIVGTLTIEHSCIDVVVMWNKAIVPIEAKFCAKDREQLSSRLTTGLVDFDICLNSMFMELFELFAVLEISVHIDKSLVDAQFQSNLYYQISHIVMFKV